MNAVTYTRNASQFNPTMTESNTVIAYNLTRWSDTISIPAKFFSETKQKFYSWDSSIVSKYIMYYEINAGDQNQQNGVFYGGLTLNRDLHIYNCSFYLITPYIFNQQGWNQIWEYNYFDITRMQAFSATNIAYTDCSIATDYTIANQYIWDNNEFAGSNSVRQVMIAWGQMLNVTLTNNKFINVVWPSNPLGTIYVPSNQYFCGKMFQYFKFENNTI
jgi:hypothetical protein